MGSEMCIRDSYSRQAALLGDLDLHRIMTLLDELGFSMFHPALSWLDVEQALADFREHLGGELSIPLLTGIGTRIEVHEIDLPLMKRCVALLTERATQKKNVGNKSALKSDVLEKFGTDT